MVNKEEIVAFKDIFGSRCLFLQTSDPDLTKIPEYVFRLLPRKDLLI